MDNGRGKMPTDNLKKLVHSIHPDINYFCLPETGNKTLALLVGSEYVEKNRPELTKAIIMDDDTLLPPNFSIY